MTISFVGIILLVSNHTSIAKDLPLANKKVVEYVESVMGTKVGRGECTDLLMGAQFYIRGVKPSKPKKNQKILPGDFIGFENVYAGGFSFPNHYAIIMEVVSPNVYTIAHQNHNGNKTVTQLTVDLNNASGKFNISRPK
jgi:hypothetical protein